MPKKQHTHKYLKQTTTGSPVWRCMLPDCNHFMPSHLEPLVIGRTSYCWECNDKFILTEQSMKRNKPLCDDCSPEVQALQQLIREQGI